MFRLFTFLVLLMVKTVASLPDNDSPNIREITFTIETRKTEDNVFHITCDHNDKNKQNNEYTVLEGEEFIIVTKSNKYINHFFCSDYTNIDTNYDYVEKPRSNLKNRTTFKAVKSMAGLWNCTVLANRFNAVVKPMVMYNGSSYSAAYCYMKIHVRRTDPPQTILVNNMALQAVRTDLSEKDIDFTAEYQYVDGDEVNVACVNFFGTATLTMEYPMADMLSDKFTSRHLSSSREIGFSTKLHSGHNNSHMICTDTETNDYTKVMVRFVMRTELNIVNVEIDGMTLRPKLYDVIYHRHRIDYKYKDNAPIKVVCEVKRTDMVLVVTDALQGFVGEVDSYNRTVLHQSRSEMSFHLDGETRELTCSSDYSKGDSAEIINIKFSNGYFPIDYYPLHMELPPNGTVMELYDHSSYNYYEKSQSVIFYEFENDEKLLLKCGPLHFLPQPAPVLYIQLNDSQCKEKGCYVTQNLVLTDQHDNSEIVCGLMEPTYMDADGVSKEDVVLKEIKVILRKRVLTTTTSTTTVQATDHGTAPKNNTLTYSLSAFGVLIFVVLLLLYFKTLKRCCYRSRAQEVPQPIPDPATAYYENLLSVFKPINEREANELENHYEEIH